MRDPKNPKPRKSQAPAVQPVRTSPTPPPPQPATTAPVPSHSFQTRIPSSAPSDHEIRLPDSSALLEAMAGIDDDGYYKLCPGNAGKSWYLSYRWRWGTWGGHYVMVVIDRGDLRYGLTLLSEKVHAVRGGHLRPTKDRYGD